VVWGFLQSGVIPSAGLAVNGRGQWECNGGLLPTCPEHEALVRFWHVQNSLVLQAVRETSLSGELPFILDTDGIWSWKRLPRGGDLSDLVRFSVRMVSASHRVR